MHRTLQLDVQPHVIRKQKTSTKPKLNVQPKAKSISKGPFLGDDEGDEIPPPMDGLVSPRSRALSKPTVSRPLGELSQEQQNSQRHGSQPSQRSHTREKTAQSPSLQRNENHDLSYAADDPNDTPKTGGGDTSSQPTTAPNDVSQQKEEQISNAIAHLLAAKERRSVI